GLVAVADLLDLGMDHAPAGAAERRRDLAVHEEALSLAEPAPEVRYLVEPDEDEQPASVAQDRLQDGPAPPPRARLVHARDLADGGRFGAGLEGGERAERAAVLVAEREMVEDVLHGAEPETGEVGGPLLADPTHHLEGLGEPRQRRLDRRVRGSILAPR